MRWLPSQYCPPPATHDATCCLPPWSAVSQVNAFKLAMAKGRTAVLVNHDNIYEALYDVLNQRYLTKRDPKTGRTQRLLRLAIGARSQLCAVHDAFKVVVIVEASHAYTKVCTRAPGRSNGGIGAELLWSRVRALAVDSWTCHCSIASRSRSSRPPTCSRW